MILVLAALTASCVHQRISAVALNRLQPLTMITASTDELMVLTGFTFLVQSMS